MGECPDLQIIWLRTTTDVSCRTYVLCCVHPFVSVGRPVTVDGWTTFLMDLSKSIRFFIFLCLFFPLRLFVFTYCIWKAGRKMKDVFFLTWRSSSSFVRFIVEFLPYRGQIY